jgi:hypothetical protein
MDLPAPADGSKALLKKRSWLYDVTSPRHLSLSEYTTGSLHESCQRHLAASHLTFSIISVEPFRGANSTGECEREQGWSNA